MNVRERVLVAGTRIGVILLNQPRIALVLSIEETHELVDELLNGIEAAQRNARLPMKQEVDEAIAAWGSLLPEGSACQLQKTEKRR